MTREEAINLLDLQLHGTPEQIEQYGSYEHATAIRMAIAALKAEPCERCVSIDAVLALAKEECETAIIPYKRFIRCVNALPLVIPMPKTGKWLVYEDCEGKTRYCVCDQCGHETGKYTWKNPDFCENCGAKMIESQESEEKR